MKANVLMINYEVETDCGNANSLFGADSALQRRLSGVLLLDSLRESRFKSGGPIG